MRWWRTSTGSVRRCAVLGTRSIVSEIHYPRPVIDWLNDQLGVAVREANLLHGATTAEVSTFEVAGRGYVLKLFNKQFFVDEEPDRAVHEAAVLEALDGGRIPSPSLVEVDGDGSICGVPAVLMTRLPGARGVRAAHAGEIVETAARMHAAGFTLPWTFRRYADGYEMRPPEWGSDVQIWTSAREIVESEPPAGDSCFIHRDYNSSNFLSTGNRITGVVDWLSGCMGPPAIDAARIRLDLTIEGRSEVAVAVSEAFSDLHDIVDPYWDLVDALDWLPFYRGFEAVDEWGDPVQRERLEGWMRGALERL